MEEHRSTDARDRGEIATRILSAARELDIEAFATYTDGDVGHVCNAAHAVRLDSGTDWEVWF